MIFESLTMRPCVEELKAEEKKKTDKLSKLWSLINDLAVDGFTGSITLHFSQGSVGRIEKYEELLKK